MEFSSEEKLEKIGEIFHIMEGHHQHSYAETACRVHQAMSQGTPLPIQDIEDLQTLTRYGLMQAREAKAQIEEAIEQSLEISLVLNEILADALVQSAAQELESLMGEEPTTS